MERGQHRVEIVCRPRAASGEANSRRGPLMMTASRIGATGGFFVQNCFLAASATVEVMESLRGEGKSHPFSEHISRPRLAEGVHRAKQW
jgi:hypothetical protein